MKQPTIELQKNLRVWLRGNDLALYNKEKRFRDVALIPKTAIPALFKFLEDNKEYWCNETSNTKW